MDRTASIQGRFGPAAAAYATSAVHRGGPDLDAMLAAAGASGGERLLDVGCGAGHTALAFAPRVASVVALDLTPAMLEEAARLAASRGVANVSFERGDAAALPFPDACFDVVASRLAAHHVARPAEMVREVARVLAPGGTFVLVDTVAPEDPARDTFLNTFELLRDPSHVRNHRVSEWQAMFREAGLAPEALGRFHYDQEFEPWVERIGTSAAGRAGLHALFESAPDEVRAHFRITPQHAFRLEAALLRGRRSAQSRFERTT